MIPNHEALKVKAILPTTETVKTVIFDVPDTLKSKFSYRAGQFLTLVLPTASGEVRRPYSISSSPAIDEPLQVTVKLQPQGRGSSYIHQDLKVGDWLQVGLPKGKFCPKITKDNHRSYFLFAAGSGITPIFSILKTVLKVEPYSHVFLFFGSRNQPNIIFKDELDQLEKAYPKRLEVTHILSQPLSRTWSALWKTVPPWHGAFGRLDAARITSLIQANPPPAQNAQYLICGPSAMTDIARTTLRAMDVPASRIQMEHFGPSSTAPKIIPVDNAKLETKFAGQSHSMHVQAGVSLLRTMLNQGLNVPFSCESGVCGTCIAQLCRGTVQMRHSAGLEESEQKAGKILTCQAFPTSQEVRIEV